MPRRNLQPGQERRKEGRFDRNQLDPFYQEYARVATMPSPHQQTAVEKAGRGAPNLRVSQAVFSPKGISRKGADPVGCRRGDRRQLKQMPEKISEDPRQAGVFTRRNSAGIALSD